MGEQHSVPWIEGYGWWNYVHHYWPGPWPRPLLFVSNLHFKCASQEMEIKALRAALTEAMSDENDTP